MRPLAVLAITFCLSAGDWNQFRGPNGSGISESGAPVEFGPEKNVIWKTPVPAGKSSPVFAGTRIFLTAHEGDKLLTLALHARTGKELWRREIVRPRSEKRHKLNDPAAPTPVTDGSNVYAFFTEFGLVSYDPKGKERWRFSLPPMSSMHGLSASPVIHDGTIILVCDQTQGSFIAAINAKTGKELWRKSRPDSVAGLYASPALYTPPGGEPQVAVIGEFELASYSIKTGERRWWVSGLPPQLKASPVIHGDTVYLACRAFGEGIALPSYSELLKNDKNGNGKMEQLETAGPVKANFSYIDSSGDGSIDVDEWSMLLRMFSMKGAAMAIRPSGMGDLTEKAVLWRADKGLPEVPSPLYYRGTMFMIRNGGILTAIDASEGTVRKTARVTVGGGSYYASPVAAGDHVYVASESGRMTVVNAAAEWEPVADIEMGEGIFATPAIVGGQLFVRTESSLYCFGRPPARGGKQHATLRK